MFIAFELVKVWPTEALTVHDQVGSVEKHLKSGPTDMNHLLFR